MPVSCAESSRKDRKFYLHKTRNMNDTMSFTVTWSEPKRFEAGNFNIGVEGVYLIGYRDTETDKRYILYVGQGDIGTRLGDHFCNKTNVKRKIAQLGRVGYYRYAKCGDEDTRLDIELGLYRKHGGSALCNEVEPPGSGRYGCIEVSEEFR